MKKLIFLACLLMAPLFLLGCGGFPSQQTDPTKNNPVTYRLDMRGCADSYPETPDGVYIKQRISCMNLKGWK